MYRLSLIIFALMLHVGVALATDPTQEFIKTINREFSTAQEGTTALYNKYGKVNVNTWQNNSVKIEITIMVNTNSQREADKTFDRIQVNFTNAWGYVKAETMIAQTSDWWPNSNGCQDFKINYEVWMPANNQLDLKNRYGNSWVDNLNGKLLAEIKYGDLRTENINNNAELNVAYGKAYLKKVKDLVGQISYGRMELTESNDIQLDTKYSEVKLEQSNNIRVTSKYDDFELGKVGELRVQAKYSSITLDNAKRAYITGQYSDLKVGSIATTIDADMTYGQLNINNLSRGFNDVKVIAKYTDVNIFVERGATYRFDAEVTHAGLRYPVAASITNRNESSNRESVSGLVGEGTNKGNVRARLQYGDLVIK